MQIYIVGDFMGLSDAKVALILSGIALVYAIKRWRTITLKKQAAERRRENEPVERSRTLEANDRSDDRTGTGNSLNVREVASELSSLLSELEETSRRVAAQIENRKAGLEILLKEADEKIKRLEALTRGSGGIGVVGRAVDGRVETKAEAKTGVTSAAQDAALTLSRLRQERGAPVAAEDPAYRPIYQMADMGKTAREIATELGRQPGEVELILALRGRQRVG